MSYSTLAKMSSSNITLQAKSNNNGLSKFFDNRASNVVQQQSLMQDSPQVLVQRAMQTKMENSPVVQRVHIGREPDVPNNYRARTTLTGSTRFHYGGGPMNIAAGIYANNMANATGAVPLPAPVVGGESDHSGQQLLDRNYASNNEPQIDHIVPVSNYGANSYSNARILSTIENNNGVAARPGAGNIVTKAYRNLRIQDTAGFDETVNQDTALTANQNARINTFGGIGPAINAHSGTQSNNVTLTEW